MFSKELTNAITRAEGNVVTKTTPPMYDPNTHINELSSNGYYKNLLTLRDLIKRACDVYMGDMLQAINVDLFMLTTSVSSPMGPGSDSEPLPIQFGDHHAYLTDSSQFGFEPLIINGMQKVYCYLPSMRGEDPDARHLNQFFHCEAEIAGTLEDVINVVEEYVNYMASVLLKAEKLLEGLSVDIQATKQALTSLIKQKNFKRVTFDYACELLKSNGFENCVKSTQHGRDINSDGEQAVLKILKSKTPVWVTHFDRDRVPFYQKPMTDNQSQVECADLIFPSLIKGSFGGEIVGAGQRQDNSDEMYESLNRQNIPSDPYEWYIELRRHKNYQTSSGFGLGIERFIAWSLCLSTIRDAIIYPREKNVPAKP